MASLLIPSRPASLLLVSSRAFPRPAGRTTDGDQF
jgi:hypothetical protein